jgi:hypothetical protein
LDTPDHYEAWGWPSADSFLYARAYVIAQGREYYGNVRGNPEAMPRHRLEGANYSFEALIYLPALAYECLTGRDDFATERSFRIESFTNEAWANTQEYKA